MTFNVVEYSCANFFILLLVCLPTESMINDVDTPISLVTAFNTIGNYECFFVKTTTKNPLLQKIIGHNIYSSPFLNDIIFLCFECVVGKEVCVYHLIL